MSNIPRFPKDSTAWTRADLAAYNIHVQFEDFPTFFGMPEPPSPTVHPDILTCTSSSATDPAAHFLLRYLEYVAAAPPLGSGSGPGVDSADEPDDDGTVRDFVMELLRAVGYARRGRVARTRMELPFVVCAAMRRATPAVCLIDDDDIARLLVVENTLGGGGGSSAAAQLVACAVAAFAAGDDWRTHTLGVPPLARAELPGIVLCGSAPVFYRVEVTRELEDAVATGVCPETPTVVRAYLPEVPRPERRWSEGMGPLDCRGVILGCFEAFKHFVE